MIWGSRRSQGEGASRQEMGYFGTFDLFLTGEPRRARFKMVRGGGQNVGATAHEDPEEGVVGAVVAVVQVAPQRFQTRDDGGGYLVVDGTAGKYKGGILGVRNGGLGLGAGSPASAPPRLLVPGRERAFRARNVAPMWERVGIYTGSFGVCVPSFAHFVD